MQHLALRFLSAALAALALAPAPSRAQDAAASPPPSEERAAQIDASNAACQPAYPAASLKAGATGTTKVRIVVTATGQITHSDIVRPSGPTLEHRLMDYAFQAAVARCPYMPGRDWKGRTVGGTVNVEYEWKLPVAPAR